MPKSPNDKLQGTLTLLVLRTLQTRGPVHGYGLCEHIRAVSQELLQVEEGSLYPALHRMEQGTRRMDCFPVGDHGQGPESKVLLDHRAR
jgi:hypothetical protein